MATLTKANAKQHCRTCLVKINVEENEILSEKAVEPEQQPESKDICIRISENNVLQSLIDKYITDERFAQNADQYPQHMCLSCFNSIQNAEKFFIQAKLSAETLYTLINNASEDAELQEGNTDIYKFLVKDSLMETETVLLENALPQEIEITNNPDPFSINIDDKNNKNADLWDSSETSDVGNDDWEASSVASSLPVEVDNDKCATRRSTRIGVKNHKEFSESPTQNTCEGVLFGNRPVGRKRKRRTKQEMEQLLSEQIAKTENIENKIKRRQKGTKNSFKCSKCHHSFAHKITLEAHIRKIHEGSTRPYHCDRCDKSYAFIGGLYTHIKEVHDKEERSHTCDFPNCGRTYTSFIAMQKHKRFKHTEEGEQKKYVCEQCGAAFNQSCNLRYHKRSKHPTEAERAKKANVKLFECEICKKMFHTCYTLKYHKMQLHSSEMKYECKICGIKKAKKFMLAQHMLVHSTDKMPCEHCGRQFIRKFELEAHVRTVHMKLKPFECKYCLECFASRKTLRHHEYIHTGEKPYVCHICGQAYRQPTCLKNHRKTHEKFLNAINCNKLNTVSSSESRQKAVETLENLEAGVP